jgi:hypothetical protein
MDIIKIMLLVAGAALLLAGIAIGIVFATWASFWKSWRKDNDADWE